MGSSPQQRKTFKTTRDWDDFVSERRRAGKKVTQTDLFELRQSCYREIEKYRGKPLLVYVTKFLEPMPPGTPNFIDLPDVDGFTDLINSVENTSAVDVLLHSPGGRPDATERLVTILRGKFKEVNFLIPHSAYSAATMLALSGNSVILHSSATLGPIDPQIYGVPARSIKRGFEKIKEKISNEGPETLPAYIPLIEKLSLETLELCEDSEKLATELVSTWLKKYMFKDEKDADGKIKKAVKYLSDYDKHLVHSRPLSSEKLIELGLKIKLADKTLQELLWEAYILLNGVFSTTPCVKLYENTCGVSWGISWGPGFLIGPDPQQETKQK